jgi:hypothetical protein
LQNRPGRILLAITQAKNPELDPAECFPDPILKLGLQKSQIWYDLRGPERAQHKPGTRDWEDEMVRLAGDLLRWDAQTHGPLATIYQREQFRRRRSQATAIALAAPACWLSPPSEPGMHGKPMFRPSEPARMRL